MENDPRTYLQDRIDILDKITNQPKAEDNWYAEYVYESIVHDKTSYLPEDFRQYIGQALNQPDKRTQRYAATFEYQWTTFFSGQGYVKITDGKPLNILDAATVWLGIGIEIAVIKPFAGINSEALLKSDRDKRIEEIVGEYIIPVLDLEVTTSIVFTKINLITNALRLRRTIEVGLRSQSRMLKALDKMDADFSDLTPVEAFDDEIETATYLMDLAEVIDDRLVAVEPDIPRQIDIFNQIRVSPMVPFCVANKDEYKTGKGVFESAHKRWFKTYSRDETDLDRYQKNGWVNDAQSLSIILYVYIGPEPMPIDVSVNSFARVVYSFKKGRVAFNKFSVELDTQDIDLLRTRLNDHLVGFRADIPANSNDQLVKIRQRFVIPNIVIDEDLFMFLVSTNTTTATLLRFLETGEPWSLKKQISFGVYLLGDITLAMISGVVTTAARIVKKDGAFQSVFKGNKILTVTLTAQNMQQYNLMRFFTLRLLTYYIKEYPYIYERQVYFFPREVRGGPRPYLQPTPEMIEEKPTFDVTAKNIKKLEQVDPQMWKFASYSRPIAPAVDLQVMPIMPEEVKTYRDLGRDVILWPVDVIGLPDEMQTKPSIDPTTGKALRLFYTTTTQGKPHITLVPNPGSNGKDYPMLPKCQASISDMMIDPADWSITFYLKERTKTSKDQLKTLKILDAGRTGPVNGSLLTYLNVTKMDRLGVERSQSSFLHCALYAMDIDPNDPDDFRYKYNKPGAEQYVVSVRKQLGRFASACLQENPDQTVAEIAHDLTNPKIFLDPSRHYRAVEELLGVNIFTATADQNKELLLQAPVHQGFYTRSKRRPLRDCIVILKLVPQQAKINREYQCEVLFAQTPDGVHGTVFDVNVMHKLESAVDALARHMLIRPTAQLVRTEEGFESQPSISVEMSNEEKIAIPTAFIKMLKAQHVDSMGKCRAVQVDFTGSADKPRLMWLLTPPLEPLCTLNIGDAEDSMSEQEKIKLATESRSLPLAEVTPSSPAGISALFAYLESVGIKVTSIAYTPRGDKLSGLWLTAFGTTGSAGVSLFAPLIPIQWKPEKFTPVRFEDPYSVIPGESPTQQLARLQKVLMMFIQVAKRLFALYWTPKADDFYPFDHQGSKETAFQEADNFVRDYMEVGVPSVPQNITGCERHIPKEAMLDFGEMLAYCAWNFPLLFNEAGTKLVCDSKEFHDNIRTRIQNYADQIQREVRASRTKATPEGSSARVTGFQPFLDYFYVSPEDFSVHSKHQMIFMSTARYQLELRSQSEAKPLLIKNINPVLVGRRAPYFYLYDDGVIKALFLIQNVLDGSASRAATLAKYWVQNKVNSGFYTPAHLGTAEILELQAPNFKIKDPVAPMIVRYQTGEYAAVLSLNQPVEVSSN